MRRPLSGIIVADFSRVLAGPLATMTLGDLGADVIKVESPAGDDTRAWGPPFASDGRATYTLSVNRNKRSIVLDLRKREDHVVARRLAVRADVLVSNFKPGGMERFGLAYEQLCPENPGLVYCAISGFGAGKGRDLPGYDPLVQAVGGLMSITGPEGGPASKTGVALVDVITGLYASTAILAALREREQGDGRGQLVEINLLHATLAALVNQASGYLNAGAVPGLLGNRHPSIEPFGTYAAGDGPLMVCAGNDHQFAALARALEAPELGDDERFTTNAGRVEHHEEVRELLERRLAGGDRAHWAAVLTKAGVPAGPVNDLAAAFELAEELRLGAVSEDHGTRTVAFPAKLGRTPAGTRLPPPELDEHGAEIRAWLSE